MKKIVQLILTSTLTLSAFAQKIPTIAIKKSDVNHLPLTDQLKETSGLIFWNERLWSHNDDADTRIYGMNAESGEVEKEIAIPNLRITDWEELQHDKTHFYIGDFGNNFKGNRTDLRILKVNKTTRKIDAIEFSYPEQTDFETQKSNTTNYDCEAFLVSDSMIYLFTKEWNSGNVTLYKVPNKAGVHRAKKIKELQVNGLVTGATFNIKRDKIVLSGYTKTLSPFLVLLENFTKDHFFDCKITKLKLPKTFFQMEAVTFIDEKTIAVTNEAFKHAIINSKQELSIINLSSYLGK